MRGKLLICTYCGELKNDCECDTQDIKETNDKDTSKYFKKGIIDDSLLLD